MLHKLLQEWSSWLFVEKLYSEMGQCSGFPAKTPPSTVHSRRSSLLVVWWFLLAGKAIPPELVYAANVTVQLCGSSAFHDLFSHIAEYYADSFSHSASKGHTSEYQGCAPFWGADKWHCKWGRLSGFYATSYSALVMRPWVIASSSKSVSSRTIPRGWCTKCARSIPSFHTAMVIPFQSLSRKC